MPPILRRFFSDADGRLVVAQWPNAPLLAWAMLALAARATRGDWQAFFAFFSAAALVAWAVLELLKGDSPFRRLLGGAVLLGMAWMRWP